MVWGLQGALSDAVPGVVLAGLIHRFRPQGALGSFLATLLSLWTVFLLFLCVSDLVYFVQCGARLDRSLWENTSWSSLRPALNVPVLVALALGLVLGAVVGRAAWHLGRRMPGRGRGWDLRRAGMGLRLAIIVGGTLPWAAAVTAVPSTLAQVKTDELLGMGQGETLARIVHGLWQNGPAWAKPPAVDLSPQDRAWAVQRGLMPPAGAWRASAQAPRWHRVVVVAVESLAQAFLDPGNARRPQGMTPFLDSLEAGRPHLDDCYSAGVDTEQGQFALMNSRTDFEWGDHPYPGRSLFSQARAAGYDTCMLFGDTLHFRDHDKAYPMALHVGRVLGKESFIGKRPAGDFCSWGGALCDRAVFEEAADYLQAQGGQPVLLLVDTLDTHPPYYWQKPDAAFPEAVRQSPDGLVKALNQLDDNLRDFLGALRARGLMDERTLVVITADHFPAYGPEPLALSGAADHGTNRIPMIFVTGRGARLGRLEQARMSSQMDLAPTLAGLMGLPVPAEFMGRDLFAQGPGRSLGRERDVLRLRVAGQPERSLLCDDRGLPRSADSPLARWYRWKAGSL
jgi:hypothetical protein